MTITVTGVLPDPMGNPMKGTTIRVTTIASEVRTPGSFGKEVTDRDGNYNFSLEEGTYRIQIQQDDEYTKGNEVLIESTLTGSIELSALIANHKV